MVTIRRLRRWSPLDMSSLEMGSLYKLQMSRLFEAVGRLRRLARCCRFER